MQDVGQSQRDRARQLARALSFSPTLSQPSARGLSRDQGRDATNPGTLEICRYGGWGHRSRTLGSLGAFCRWSRHGSQYKPVRARVRVYIYTQSSMHPCIQTRIYEQACMQTHKGAYKQTNRRTHSLHAHIRRHADIPPASAPEGSDAN